MKIAIQSENGKGNPIKANSLLDIAKTLNQLIRIAADEVQAFREFESEWHEMIYCAANLGAGFFISE